MPLAGSDDDSTSRRSKSKKGRKKEDDESWCPKAKVGPVGHRESKSSRVNAKREAVEKGLEKASVLLENVGFVFYDDCACTVCINLVHLF